MTVTYKTKMWFGKHKGTKMSEVPASYLLQIYNSPYKTDNDFMHYVRTNLKEIEERAKRESKINK